MADNEQPLNPEPDSPRQSGMDLAAWRKSRIFQVVTPSGLAITMKRVSLMDLVTQGTVPDSLLGFFDLAMKSAKKSADGQGKVEMEAEQIPELVQAFNAVAKACVIDPPLADEADDEHLSVDELPFNDKGFIFEKANEEAESLKPFRRQ